jgi:hypothetical protein
MSCSCGCGGEGTCNHAHPLRSRVHDRLAGHESCRMVMHDRSTVFHCDAVGKSQSMTPEGFLICHDVPIARTGEYLYGPGETPLEPGPDSMVHIWRSPDEVFHKDAIASFEGKDVVDDHPNDGVTPDNWRDLAVGHIQNVHKGEGVNDDYLFADLVIKDLKAIKAIQEGKKEVSAGYDAEYRSTGPGRGEQYNIRGNHVALVDRGRCGPRCAIKDHQGELPMSKPATFKDRLMAMFGAKDEAEFLKALDKPAPTTDEGGELSESGTSMPHIVINNHGMGQGGERAEPKLVKEQDEEEPGAEGAGNEIGARIDRLEQAVSRIIQMLDPNGGEENDPNELDERPEENPDEHTSEDPEEGREDILRRRDGDRARDRLRLRGKDKGRGIMRKDAEGESEEETEEEKRKRLETEREMAEDAKDAAPAQITKAKDSAFFTDSFQDTAALAAIIAPGIEIPAFDKTAAPKKTFDSMTRLRCKALDAAYEDQEFKGFIDDTLGGKTYDCKTLSLSVQRSLFRSVGAMAKRRNQQVYSKDFGFTHASSGGMGVKSKVRSPADLNKLHADRYGVKPFN